MADTYKFLEFLEKKENKPIPDKFQCKRVEPNQIVSYL